MAQYVSKVTRLLRWTRFRVHNHFMLTLHVAGKDIQVGDIFRFRMSKHEPARWLTVLSISGPDSRGTVGLTLEQGCWYRVIKSQTARVRRAFVAGDREAIQR